ncbi:MAG TPA: DUF2752 domain-containing protein [Acidimicrobiia bacterium]|nr:DUF2752 domain-containing protein [Acidimicrobiia bacterium]
MSSVWRYRMVLSAPIGLIGFLALLSPDGDGPTVCPFALCTGMACPGCGMTRAASNLIRGNMTTALAYHPLIPLIAAMAVGGWLWYQLRRSERVRPLPTRWVNAILIGTGVMLLGVWVARALAGTLPPV